MSEATGRQEMERRLIEKSVEDEAFRQQLLTDPRAIIQRELGTQLPEEVWVVAVEETADTIYLVCLTSRRSTRRLASSPTGSLSRWPAAAPGAQPLAGALQPVAVGEIPAVLALPLKLIARTRSAHAWRP